MLWTITLQIVILKYHLTGAKRGELSGMIHNNCQSSSQQPPATHPATLRKTHQQVNQVSNLFLPSIWWNFLQFAMERSTMKLSFGKPSKLRPRHPLPSAVDATTKPTIKP